MSTRKVLPLIGLTLLVLTFTISVTGQSGDRIVVNNADEVRQESLGIVQTLLDFMADTRPRIILQYANQVRHLSLQSLPASLQALLAQVPARIVVQYANAVRHLGLETLPPTLQTLLRQMSDRIILQSANANREMRLSYPTALIADSTPPQIRNVAAHPVGTDSTIITWDTDEFADSTVSYGEQSGNYTLAALSVLYVTEHAITLTGLKPGRTYYYKVQSRDLSGNVSQTPEHTFSSEMHVYLPVVLNE
jgi:hypothetical protein